MKRVIESGAERKPRVCLSRVLAKLPNFRAISAQAERDGLWVLPAALDRGAKHPAIPWKVYQRRRPTTAEVAAWVSGYPDRNGVYLTGPILGRFVVDCDSAAAVRWLRRKGVPRTQQVVTARGRHFHFAYPEGLHVGNSAGVIHEGVDIRGDKGVAVAVGSVHRSGRIYRWARGRSRQDDARQGARLVAGLVAGARRTAPQCGYRDSAAATFHRNSESMGASGDRR